MSRTGIILLVEDNPDDVELTMRALDIAKVANKIVVARDGEEALDYLFRTGTHATRDPRAMPEIVLLDLKLPKVDGLEVLKRLRASESTRRLPVIVLTSSNEDRDIDTSYDLGANSFIQKPVNFSEFMAAAAQLGLYWLVLNQSSRT